MVHAISKYNRVSPKKANRVAKLIRKQSYEKALSLLSHLPQLSAKIIKNTLKSAGANLIQKNPNSTEDMWYIKHIFVLKGPYYKRIRPRSRGSANHIQKPLTHIKVVLEEQKDKN